MGEVLAVDAQNLHAWYGSSHILFDIGLGVPQGSTVAVLGRNGVGKTTLLRALSNTGPTVSGTVRLFGQDARGAHPFELARRGIAFVAAERNIFPTLTTEQNLAVVVTKGSGSPWTPERLYELFPNLRSRRRSLGWQLSGGEQQMLAIARGLAAGPRLLLLDEPAEGLAPIIVSELIDVLNRVKEEGITVLVAEQSAAFCRAVADQGIVMSKGQIIHEGPVASLLDREEVVATLTAG